jgi:hypothetical protein
MTLEIEAATETKALGNARDAGRALKAFLAAHHHRSHPPGAVLRLSLQLTGVQDLPVKNRTDLLRCNHRFRRNLVWILPLALPAEAVEAVVATVGSKVKGRGRPHKYTTKVGMYHHYTTTSSSFFVPLLLFSIGYKWRHRGCYISI